jgi:signal transduction histidine kinase
MTEKYNANTELGALQAKIDEQDKQLNELKNTVFYLNSIIKRLPGSVFWKDINGVYLGCNDFVQKEMAGVEDIIGKTDYDLPWHEEADYIRKQDKQVMEKGEAITGIDESPKLISGEQRVFRATKAPLKNEEGKVIGVIGISYDVTAEEEAKELKLEKVAAEERIEAIRLMGMSLAHELRTPLRAISASAVGTNNKLPSLLAIFKIATDQGIEIPAGYPDIFPSDITFLEGIFKTIELETEAAFSVIDMLLIKGNLSKIDKAKFTNCKISTCINNALKRYPFKPGEEKLVEYRGGDFTYHGDTLLVVHVLFNLIKNALYYVKRARKGSIKIWIDNKEFTNILHFKDTGTGISSDNLSHMFEQFFSTESNGTGIGLAFCKLVMQSMDGAIECSSVEGEYTEFILTFPKVSE